MNLTDILAEGLLQAVKSVLEFADLVWTCIVGHLVGELSLGCQLGEVCQVLERLQIAVDDDQTED